MSEISPKILIIPIDARPVCYDLPLNIAQILNDAEVFMPDKTLLGDMSTAADIQKIQGWTKHILNSHDIDIIILSLDTIAYGGLIQSRRISAKFEQIKANVDEFIKILSKSGKNKKIYATSSIMRISDNNCNEEEKSYWETYGKSLFRFSYLSHKLLKNYDVEIESELVSLAKKIPFEVVDDYLDTRKRNFDINSYYIELTKKGVFEHLVFSQDDAAEFGFNIEEKELLYKQALKELISDKVTIKTGADEMPLTLLSRAISDFYSEKVDVNPVYFSSGASNIISLYEDVSIDTSMKNTITLSGGQIIQGADLKILVNAPTEVQDELCLCIYKDKIDNSQADKLIDFINTKNFRYMIADVKKANGADNYLMDKFMDIPYDSEHFYGYAGWNTTGNTLGTVIATGIIKHIAIKHGMYNEDAFKKLQFTRFMDDWAYQANVRKTLRLKGSTNSVKTEMKKYEDIVAAKLQTDYTANYTFPWNRTFEVEVDIK